MADLTVAKAGCSAISSKVDPSARLEQTLERLLGRPQRLLDRELAAVVGRFGLSFTDCLALQLIVARRATAPSDIAKILGRDTGGATRLVDRLEAKGLVVRKRPSKDRRRVSVLPTPDADQRADLMLRLERLVRRLEGSP